MHLGVLIAVVAYEVIVICGVSWALNKRQQEKLKGADFTTSSGNMNVIAVAATMALTSLGGGHILGMPGQSPSTGIGTYWYILSSGMMMVILCCYVGPWYIRLKVNTVAELFKKLYNHKVAILLTALTAGCTWGVITLEMQSVGTILSAVTGWALTLCCIIGGIISILYVIFAGMREVAWVNVINAIFMYVGVIIACIYLGSALSQVGSSWSAVNDYYTSNGQGWMLNLWANSDTWRTYIIGTVLGQLFFVPMNQAGCQCSVSAKNVKTLKRSVFLAVPLNCIFGIFMIAFGMVANSLPQYAGVYGGPMDTFAMLVDLLPTWVIIWLLAGFAAAVLSTIAVCVLGISTLFVHDVVQKKKPDMDDKEHLKWLRIGILIFAGVACIVSTLLPSVNTSMVWLFSWLLPAFWMFVFGMHWKRSSKAALWTIIISAVANCVWSLCTPLQTMLHLDGANNSLVMLFFTMIVGIIAVLLDKDAKPGLIKLYKQDKQRVLSSDDV